MAGMTQNKKTVETYMAAFRQSDHVGVMATLTDDVEWVLPGAFHLTGKAAFDKEMENPAFTGKPDIRVTRLVEEKDVVVAEGTVRAEKSQGGFLDLVFCDVFEMRGGKIRKLISYLMEIKK